MIEHKPLIDYLPPFLQEYREYKRLFNVLQDEISENPKAILKKVESAETNTFIALAGIDGIEHYEKMFKIIPNAQATLEDRRMTILAKLNASLPYTYKILQATLDNLLGAEQYRMEMTDVYELTIWIAKSSYFQRATVKELLDKILPANIGTKIELKYNQHQTFINVLTHDEMSNYTHQQLREDKIV